jgi:hypothetical protein
MSILIHRKPGSGGFSTVPLSLLNAKPGDSPITAKPKNEIVMKTPEPKRRLTKAETIKAEKEEIMSSLSAFAETKPSKKDVREYFKSRLESIKTK